MALKTLLLTTDFSAEARKAYRCAAELARRFECTIHVVYVREALPPLFPESDKVTSVKQAEEELSAELSREAAFRGLPVQTHVLTQQSPFEALKRFVEEKKVDLLVMASCGRTGVEYFLLGSFAERVVHTSRVPVLVVRGLLAEGAVTPPRELLVPFDFSEASRAVLPAVRFLIAQFNLHATFLFVHEPLPSQLSWFQRFLEALRSAPKRVEELFGELVSKESLSGAHLESLEGNPALKIIERAETMGADLIVIGTQVTLGSVAQKVTRKASCSVLTVPSTSA
jgi:nucleotide-binding universal stress UspA family protein